MHTALVGIVFSIVVLVLCMMNDSQYQGLKIRVEKLETKEHMEALKYYNKEILNK